MFLSFSSTFLFLFTVGFGLFYLLYSLRGDFLFHLNFFLFFLNNRRSLGIKFDKFILVTTIAQVRYGILACNNRIGYGFCVQPDGSDSVIVTRYHVIHTDRTVITVHYTDHGNLQFDRFADCDILIPHVDHEQGVRPAFHILDACQVTLQFFQFPLIVQNFLLVHAFHAAVGLHLLQFPQAIDGPFHRLVVGQQSAQPAQVDIRHLTALGFFPDYLLCGALCPHEQYLALVGRQLADKIQGFLEHGLGLLKVDDMYFISVAVQVCGHFRIPIAGLVAKMYTRLQHFSHADISHKTNSKQG